MWSGGGGPRLALGGRGALLGSRIAQNGFWPWLPPAAAARSPAKQHRGQTTAQLKKKTQERQSQTCPRASGLPAAGRGRLWLAPHDPLAGQLPRLLGAPEASLWELHHVYGAHQVQRLLAPASVTVQSPGTACPSGLGPQQETAVPVGDTHTSALQPRLREPGLGDTSACAVPQEASGNPLLPPS